MAYPDWSKPVGITTPRVGANPPKQASGYPESWNYEPVIPVENEDRGQRNELADDAIWAAYEAGY